MQYQAKSPDDYIDQIPNDRKEPISQLRKTIKDNLPKGFEEGINYGMIGYYVPHAIYPKGYHCDSKLPLPFLNIASQKNSINFYHMGIYSKPELHHWFVAEYPKHCKRKLDMGKSCVRFKYMDEIPYDLIADLCKRMTVQEWIAIYESVIENK